MRLDTSDQMLREQAEAESSLALGTHKAHLNSLGVPAPREGFVLSVGCGDPRLTSLEQKQKQCPFGADLPGSILTQVLRPSAVSFVSPSGEEKLQPWLWFANADSLSPVLVTCPTTVRQGAAGQGRRSVSILSP